MLDTALLNGCATKCVAFSLRKASRAITRLYGNALAAVRLETTQFTLLVACARQESVSVSALAGRLATERSALARNIAVLEQRGYLRVTAGVDRRVRLVSITREGELALEAAYPLWQAAQQELELMFGEKRLAFIRDELAAISEIGSRAKTETR